jgi:hypothetical protein
LYSVSRDNLNYDHASNNSNISFTLSGFEIEINLSVYFAAVWIAFDLEAAIYKGISVKGRV